MALSRRVVLLLLALLRIAGGLRRRPQRALLKVTRGGADADDERRPQALRALGVPRGGGRPIVFRLLSLGQIMNLDVIQTKWHRAAGLATSLTLYIGSFCKAWHPRLARDIFVPKSGFLTWSVLAYWAYALKQIYLAGGRAAMLSKEALGPAACAIAGYFLLANLPELSGV